MKEMNDEFPIRPFQDIGDSESQKEILEVKKESDFIKPKFESDASNSINSTYLKNSPYFVYFLKGNKNRFIHENKDHVTSKFSKNFLEENLLLLAEAATSKKRDLKLFIKNQNSNSFKSAISESSVSIYQIETNSFSGNASFLYQNESNEDAKKKLSNVNDYLKFPSFENCKSCHEKEIEKCDESKANPKTNCNVKVAHKPDIKCIICTSPNQEKLNSSENVTDFDYLGSECKEEKKKCPLGHSITSNASNVCKKCSKQFEKCKNYAAEYKGQLISQKMNQELEFRCSNGHCWITKFSKKYLLLVFLTNGVLYAKKIKDLKRKRELKKNP